MHKTLRRLPSLDFLRGFEAAGRRLSFTLAAEELFLTQSALSRQVKALEDALGVPLFERRHRALALTPRRRRFHRTVTEKLRELAAAADAVRAPQRRAGTHGVHDRVVRVAVADPAAARVPRRASAASTSTSPPTTAWSTWRAATSTSRSAIWPTPRAPRDAVRLFGERLLPVASPGARASAARRSRKPADLAHTCCCISTIPGGLDAVAQLAGVAHRQRRGRT